MKAFFTCAFRRRRRSPFGFTLQKRTSTHHPQNGLRDYQESLLSQSKNLVSQGARRIMCPIATGLGKTVILANLPLVFPEFQKRGCLVIVHRDELVQQIAAAFQKWCPNFRVGIEQGKQTVRDPRKVDVIISTVQTLGRKDAVVKRKKLQNFAGIVFVDEAHHVKCGSTYDTVLKSLGLGKLSRGKKPQSGPVPAAGSDMDRLLFGFSATPYRRDGYSLGNFFEHWLVSLDNVWGILNGYLVDIRGYRIKSVTDLNGVKISMNEFQPYALEDAVNNDTRNAAIVKAVVDYGGEKIIVYTAGVKHAHDLAQKFVDHGIPATAIHGKSEREERRKILEDFKNGSLKVITNCSVLTEGFDAPNCDTIVMARPTMSRSLYLQMKGRGMRPSIHFPPPPTTAQQRREMIQASRKSHMILIDVCDQCDLKLEVMSLTSSVGLGKEFDMEGRTVEDVMQQVHGIVKEEGLVDEYEQGELDFKPCTSIQDVRLAVQRFILERLKMGQGKEERTLEPWYLRDAAELMPGDKMGGMGWGLSKRIIKPVVRVTSIKRDSNFAVVVEMKDSNGNCYSWRTSRVRDSENEELFRGKSYILSGVIVSRESPSVVSMKNCRLWPLSEDERDCLWGEERKVKMQALSADMWEKLINKITTRLKGRASASL